jgi:homoserine kinase type II
MAQFRILAPGDLRDILDAFGLPPTDYLGHTAIAAGTINTNVRVDTPVGPRFVRINEGKSEDDVAREAAIVAHLAEGGLPTPRPIQSAAGLPYVPWRGQLVSMFPWVEGRVLGRAELGVGEATEVGRALGRLHRLGASFPDRRPGRYEPEEIARRLAQVAAVARRPAEPDPALVAAVARLEPELGRATIERASVQVPMGLIHGDLFVDNVLFGAAGAAGGGGGADGDGGGGGGGGGGHPLVALLDFEQASWGRWIYDVAVTALAFAFGRDDFRMELVEGLLGGYQTERPLTEVELGVFGAELRFAACRFAVTRVTDVYLKRAFGAPGGKDYRRYLARLDRLHARLAADPRAFVAACG